MNETMLNVLQYYGAGAAVIAAALVAANLGRLITGWAFILFVTSSSALIAWGFLNDEGLGIGYQNIFMLAINLLGVYRYLIAKNTPAHG